MVYQPVELADVVDTLCDRLDRRKVRLAVTLEGSSFDPANMAKDTLNAMAFFFQEEPTRLSAVINSTRHNQKYDLTDTVTKRLYDIKYGHAVRSWDCNYIGSKGSGKSISMLFMSHNTQMKLWEQAYDPSTFYLTEMHFCIDSRWNRNRTYKNNFVCIDEQGAAMREMGEGSQLMHLRFMAERQLFRPYRSPIFQCSTDHVNTQPHHVCHVLGVDDESRTSLVAETSPDTGAFLGYFFTGLPEQKVLDDYQERREHLIEYTGSLKFEYWTPFIDKLFKKNDLVAKFSDPKAKITDKLVELWCAEEGEKVGKGESTFLKTMILSRLRAAQAETGDSFKSSEQVTLSEETE